MNPQPPAATGNERKDTTMNYCGATDAGRCCTRPAGHPTHAGHRSRGATRADAHRWPATDAEQLAEAVALFEAAGMLAADPAPIVDTVAEVMTCARCAGAVHPLEVFPGTLCLSCYTPIGEREARTMTADKLAGMWGGVAR